MAPTNEGNVDSDQELQIIILLIFVIFPFLSNIKFIFSRLWTCLLYSTERIQGSTMRPGQATLRAVPMFERLDKAVLAELDAIADLRDVPQGQELCRQGARPAALHVLLDGQVALSGTAPDGTSAVVEVVRPIGHFVMAAALTDLPYLMTGHSIMPSRLLLIEAVALRELLAREAALTHAMLRAQALDYRAMVRQVRDLKLRSAAQRLGCY